MIVESLWPANEQNENDQQVYLHLSYARISTKIYKPRLVFSAYHGSLASLQAMKLLVHESEAKIIWVQTPI